MPRKLRFQYPGAMYPVMSRGDRREAIFGDDEDRQRFVSTLGEACQKTEWQVHAYLEDELRGRAQGHRGKAVIARRLPQETTMSLKWIALWLEMGSWTHVANLLNDRTDVSPAQEVLPLCQ